MIIKNRKYLLKLKMKRLLNERNSVPRISHKESSLIAINKPEIQNKLPNLNVTVVFHYILE